MKQELKSKSRRDFIKLSGLGIAGITLPIGLNAFSIKDKSSSLVYIGTYTDGESKGIYLSSLNNSTGELKILSSASGIENPSFLALHPNRKYLYAVVEVTDFKGNQTGAVSSFEVSPKTGGLTLINTQSTEGGAPCYVHVDKTGSTVLVANYVGGNVIAYPIQKDGSLGTASSMHKHKGSDAGSEKDSHAHCFITDPENNFAFAADLGLDRLFAYRLDTKESKVTPHEAGNVKVKPGAGPRHFTFHPNGKFAYLINELNSTMSAFSYNKGNGILKELQTVSTLPAGFQGESNCADVHVSPNGRFLYGSNRGHNSIVVYQINQKEGTLSLVQHVSTQGNWPRNFGISPTGQILMVANQKSNDIFTFFIDSKSGKLEPTGKKLEVPSPVFVHILNPET